LLSHKYIIGFRGISTTDGNDLYIVTEFAENGSIYDYIEKLRKEKKTVWGFRSSCCTGSG